MRINRAAAFSDSLLLNRRALEFTHAVYEGRPRSWLCLLHGYWLSWLQLPARSLLTACMP